MRCSIWHIFVIKLERVEGIEPSHRPWQGCRLPLHHTRVIKLVDPARVELATAECKSAVLPLAPRAHKVAEGEGAAPSGVFRPRQFSKLLRLPNYSSTFQKMAEAAGVEPARVFRPQAFSRRFPRPTGLLP